MALTLMYVQSQHSFTFAIRIRILFTKIYSLIVFHYGWIIYNKVQRFAKTSKSNYVERIKRK